MTALAEKLSDLSVHVGDIEARIAAFRGTQERFRDQKVSALKSGVQARIEDLDTRIHNAGDDISSVWTGINQSLKIKAEQIQALIESKRQATDAQRAEHRTQHLERNALLAIEFAALAIEEAEVAVSEAVDARLHANAIAAKHQPDVAFQLNAPSRKQHQV
ncbi:hypothetical protein [Labrenzia sp. VG12]|uniref:hypothetical protein n=1 Tax=Labrenzia sp. VG12 TaxID=2021862 RepID=UPI000B8C5003|nr:hypothetical protein [Labrenzia sp. VG12]ASP35648.1 hypothetical protein CHH27_22385 [Labrenzia sp. VG12]